MNSTQDTKLSQRHSSEEQFHDLKYSENRQPAHYKFNPTYKIFLSLLKKIQWVSKIHILECGCGTGWITAELSSKGAIVDSFDISGEAVNKTVAMLKKKNLDTNCNVRKMSAEALDYPDNTFDVVIGFAILHHLDMNKAIPELYRVLKPGGRALFAEPLGHNVFLNIYRKLTPDYRTKDERPIHLNEFSNQVNQFKCFSHEEYYLTALFALLISYIPLFNKYIDNLITLLMRFDKKLLKKFPILDRFAWYSIFELEK